MIVTGERGGKIKYEKKIVLIIIPRKKKNAAYGLLRLSYGRSNLETVNLDGRFLYPIFNQEVGDVGTLISLELDNLTHFLIVNNGSVAGEFFLEFLEYFLEVVFLTQALQGGQSLPSIPLLDTDMNVIGLRSNVTSISKRIASLSKGIESVKVLYAHSTRMDGRM